MMSPGAISLGRSEPREALRAIGELERENRLSGARFSIRKGARIDVNSGAFVVLEATKVMVDLLGRIDSIPKVEYRAPG